MKDYDYYLNNAYKQHNQPSSTKKFLSIRYDGTIEKTNFQNSSYLKQYNLDEVTRKVIKTVRFLNIKCNFIFFELLYTFDMTTTHSYSRFIIQAPDSNFFEVSVSVLNNIIDSIEDGNEKIYNILNSHKSKFNELIVVNKKEMVKALLNN